MTKFRYSMLLLLLFMLLRPSSANEEMVCSPKKKLFVFGDSYLDTGNSNPPVGPWNLPFGITNPGKPTGRFSDGLVATDFIASLLGLHSPVPYLHRMESKERSGINFAVGGAGLYPTTFNNESMMVQMGHLEDLIKEGAYSLDELQNSVAFVSISGNDYGTYKEWKFQDLPSFTITVVAQLAANLQKLHTFGIGNVAVASLPPLGCLPQNAANSSYPGNCNETINSGSRYHNHLLKKAVETLNQVNKRKGFAYIDFYEGFYSAMDEHFKSIGSNPTVGCCLGKGVTSCGSVENGNPAYTLCEHPEQSFFWDLAHPAQHGWQLVIDALGGNLLRSLICIQQINRLSVSSF